MSGSLFFRKQTAFPLFSQRSGESDDECVRHVASLHTHGYPHVHSFPYGYFSRASVPFLLATRQWTDMDIY